MTELWPFDDKYCKGCNSHYPTGHLDTRLMVGAKRITHHHCYNGVAIGICYRHIKKLDEAEKHIIKEIRFNVPDMTEGAWLNEKLEIILKILRGES